MTLEIENSPLAMCIDCTKLIEGKCSVYPSPPSFYQRRGVCAFNPPKVEVKKTFVNPLKASKAKAKGK